MNNQHLLLWLLLAAVFIGSACWHIRENRKLGQQWRQTLQADTAKRLVKFAWLRSFQVLFVLACFLLFVVAYVGQLADARNTIDQLEKLKADLDQQLAQVVAKNATSPTTQQPASATPSMTATGNAYVAPTAPASPPSTSTPNTRSTIADVYNPEGQSNDKQSKLDTLKKQYEDILVIYRFLNKCGRTQPTDYTIIISALQQEMATVNAPNALQSEIMTAAEGSYREMYALSPCNGSGFSALNTQYRSYVKMLAQRFPLRR